LKILFLSQGENISDHPGWHDALVRLKKEEVISDFKNIPYLGYAKEYGWDAFYQEVISLCDQQAFDVVYFHYFHKKGKPSPKKCIEALLSLKDKPVVITSAGDGFSDNWMRPDYPEDFKEASKLADITFSTQMGRAADKMVGWGASNVVYTPNSMCQVRFKADAVHYDSHDFDFDIVFVGSNNGDRFLNPISKYWWGAKKRNLLVQALYKRFERRFGLFGNGWNYSCAQGPVPFNQQQNTFRRGRILVGGNPYSHSDYYSSNRVFFEISSGVPTVELSVPRLDKVLRNKEHCYFASDVDEVIERCEYLLDADPKVIYSKAGIAAKYIEQNHTQYHRMKFKIDSVRKYINNGRKLNIEFPFFLPEVDLNEELPFAIRQM
jgi:hypothetical protein